MDCNRITSNPPAPKGAGLSPNNMEKILTVKAFDVEADGRAIIENLKTFEEAEAFIIAHDKKMYADWLLASNRNPERTEEFNHHQYLIYHSEGKVTADDVFAKMSFEELCDEAFGWRAISVVEFKF